MKWSYRLRITAIVIIFNFGHYFYISIHNIWDYVGSGPWNTSYIVSVPDCGTAKFSGGVGGGYIDYDDGDHFAN